MDPMVSRSGDLLPPVTLDPRLHGCKPHHNDIMQGPDNGEAQEILNAQYINLHRLSENLPKVQLDSLSNDLLGQHVVEIPPSGSIVSPNGTTGYYGEDLLGNDLTEEDKKLAAALVAVQLVQQKQNALLTTDLLNTKAMAPLSPFNPSPVEKPGMAAMVTSYIQAFEEEAAAQHLLETSPHAPPERKSYSAAPTPLPDLRLPALPPLKKVLSTQNLMHSRSKKIYFGQHLDPETVKHCVDDNLKLPKIDEMDTSLEEPCLEDIESDYEIDSELKPSRRSLPHKKRIPKKLKTQPQRSIHSKCYKCQKCGDSFSNQSSFFHHRSQHFNPPKRSSSFSCEICSFQSSNQIVFFEHLKTHYEPKNAVESVIQTDLPDFSDDNVHNVVDSFSLKADPINRAKKSETPSSITCEHCGKIFNRQRMYEAHKASMHSLPLEEFSEPEDMMEGIRHVVNIQAACPDEDNEEKQLRSWKDLGSLENSIATSTPEKSSNLLDSFEISPPSSGETSKKKAKKKELPCPHCPRIFSNRTSLVYHIRSHTGKRPHQCEVCGKSFYATNALKVHMRLHSGDKPYKCETCGRCFRQWGDLRYHVTSLHSTQKQYQCEFCGKDFARKYSLIVHRRIHTNEKNYICEFCSKTFRASSYLSNHRRIHTGEKPYPCDICNKNFRVKSDLKRHQATHNKIRNIPSVSIVLANQQAEGTASMVVGDQSVEQTTESLMSAHSNDSECIIPDVSAPLNLMRSDATDGLAYSRDGITLDRDQNTLYVWLPAGPDSILPD